MSDTPGLPPPAAPLAPNPLAIALGSVPVELADSAGAPLAVTVRLLRVTEFEKFFTLIDREEELVAFAVVCAEPDWVARLSPNTLLDLVDRVMDLNFTTALRWSERRARLGLAAESFKARTLSAASRT